MHDGEKSRKAAESKGEGPKSDAGKARAAEALRANLKRRKQQLAARKSSEKQG